MDAVAYIDPAVVSFVNQTVIPVRTPGSDPELGSRYKVKWTPTLLLLDADGVEQYLTLVFYPPQELIPSLLLGIGQAKFNLPDRPAACDCFGEIIGQYPDSPQAPEAIYLNGVARYIESHDVANLIGIYDRLAAAYPADPWLTRADPYRLLKK
jgi:tetratricopeptide (TPR) repeat protein